MISPPTISHQFLQFSLTNAKPFFLVQFERYLLAKKEENVPECCKILIQLLNLPENDALNEEIEKIVEVVKSTSNSNEDNFQKQLFTSLTEQQQYQLLLKVATKCTDQTNYCQLMMLILKKFPSRINEHALTLVDIINQNKNRPQQTTYLKDYFCKLLIFEVFPLILSEESNLKLSTEQVEKLLENLFEIYFQQSAIGKVADDETLQIDCYTTLNAMQAKLREIFNLIRIKMDWDPFAIPEQLTLDCLQEQYDKLIELYKKYSVYSPVGQPVDAKKLKQVFYTSFMLFLVYLDNYIRLTVSRLIVVQRSSPVNVKSLNAKKRKLNELKNAPICTDDELSIRLQTAFSGTNQIFAFLNQVKTSFDCYLLLSINLHLTHPNSLRQSGPPTTTGAVSYDRTGRSGQMQIL